jgi:hypothetical protein
MSNPSVVGERTTLPSLQARADANGMHRGLKLAWPNLTTPLLTAGFVLLLFLVSEVAVRSHRFQSAVGAPSLGGRHHLFEMQVHYLNRLVRQSGRIDCLFLGNSMVWQGIDVQAFRQRYREMTGRDIICYNFGVDGLPASAAGHVAQMLVHDYEPRLLIYGTDARDYAVPADAPDAVVVNEMAWLRYRNGQFSPEGWVYDHVYLLRYRRILRDVARFDFWQVYPREVEQLMAANSGSYPDPAVGTYVTTPPDPRVQEGPIAYYFGLLSNYALLSENLAGLETVLEQAPQTRVLVVEMPVPQTYMTFFGNGERDHQRFLFELTARAANHGVPFWSTTAKQLIPLDGWLDYSHLNATGAQVFSAWLGERIGQTADKWGLEAAVP